MDFDPTSILYSLWCCCSSVFKFEYKNKTEPRQQSILHPHDILLPEGLAVASSARSHTSAEISRDNRADNTSTGLGGRVPEAFAFVEMREFRLQMISWNTLVTTIIQSDRFISLSFFFSLGSKFYTTFPVTFYHSPPVTLREDESIYIQWRGQ